MCLDLVCVQFRFSVFRLQCVQLSMCPDFSVRILFVLYYSDSGVSDSGVSDSAVIDSGMGSDYIMFRLLIRKHLTFLRKKAVLASTDNSMLD